MTRARTKALHDKVNSLLCTFDLDTPSDGILLHPSTLCILSYDPHGVPQDGQALEDRTDGSKSPRGGEGLPAKPAVLPPAPAGTTASPSRLEPATAPYHYNYRQCPWHHRAIAGTYTGMTVGPTAGINNA